MRTSTLRVQTDKPKQCGNLSKRQSVSISGMTFISDYRYEPNVPGQPTTAAALHTVFTHATGAGMVYKEHC